MGSKSSDDESSHTAQMEDLDIPDTTFAPADLATLGRLDGRRLEVARQLLTATGDAGLTGWSRPTADATAAARVPRDRSCPATGFRGGERRIGSARQHLSTPRVAEGPGVS